MYAALSLLFCGSELARDGGLTADQDLADAHRSNCGSGLAREGGLPADQSLAGIPGSTVGASLLAMAVCQSTRYLTDERNPRTGRPVGRLGRCCGVRLLVRPSAGSAQWATRHGCRVSRPRPWMADGGGLCRSELAREKPESTAGCQAPRIIVDLHRSKLAPTGIVLGSRVSKAPAKKAPQ